MKKYIHMSLVALMTVGSVCAMDLSDTESSTVSYESARSVPIVVEHLATKKNIVLNVHLNMTGQMVINLFNKQTGANAKKAIFLGQDVTNQRLGNVASESDLKMVGRIILL